MTLLTADCPKCDPCNPELDEDGHAYACYFCGDTGRVPQAQADAYWQELTDADECFAPRRLGIFVRPAAHEYDYGDDDYGDEGDCVPGHRLFTRLIRTQRPAPAPMTAAEWVAAWGDDIPF